MYGQYEQPETDKKKIVIVSAIMGVIILILLAILICGLIKKARLAKADEEGRKDDEIAYVMNEDGELVAVSGDQDMTNSSASAEDEKLSPVSGEATTEVAPSSEVIEDSNNTSATNSGASASSNTSTSSNTSMSSTSSIPNTGAEGIFGLALLLGSVAAYLSSRRLATE